MQMQRLASADFDAVTGDLHVGILRSRAIGSGKDVGTNIRRAFGKYNAGAGGLNGNVPPVSGHIPIEFVMILEKFQRVRNSVFDRNRLRGIVGVRDVNLQLARVALAAAFILERPATRVRYPLYVQEQGVIQPLRGDVFHRDRSIKPMPWPTDKMRLNVFGDIDGAVGHHEGFGMEIFDAQFAGAVGRNSREDKSRNYKD